MTPDKLPHDDYMRLVVDALAALGYVAPMWTESPDGVQLDGVFEIDDDELSGDRWPHGVTLAWDQSRGWQLITGGSSRDVTRLPLDTYARPADVAALAHARLIGAPDPAVTPWGQADELEAAVTAWEES